VVFGAGPGGHPSHLTTTVEVLLRADLYKGGGGGGWWQHDEGRTAPMSVPKAMRNVNDARSRLGAIFSAASQLNVSFGTSIRDAI
jgi:hypothetical protein